MKKFILLKKFPQCRFQDQLLAIARRCTYKNYVDLQI